mmetsp:Transcript_6769/g.14850  ORF Transcript_6769/g.14850 Transcript_6769/m.14850 type:complete len:209 (+) Transcript_6769:53-679(+)
MTTLGDSCIGTVRLVPQCGRALAAVRMMALSFSISACCASKDCSRRSALCAWCFSLWNCLRSASTLFLSCAVSLNATSSPCWWRRRDSCRRARAWLRLATSACRACSTAPLCCWPCCARERLSASPAIEPDPTPAPAPKLTPKPPPLAPTPEPGSRSSPPNVKSSLRREREPCNACGADPAGVWGLAWVCCEASHTPPTAPPAAPLVG